MSWDDLRVVLALARAGSARGAGASLGVSHSTVVRRVESLEQQLGVRLFDRGADGYALTAAGADLVRRAEPIERDLASLERALVGQDTRLVGRVAVTCTDRTMAGLVLQVMEPFLRANPEIELELTADGRSFDLSRREADIAVRAVASGAAPPGHLIGQHLAPIHLGAYVASAHAHRLDPAREGREARWLGYKDDAIQRRVLAMSTHPALPVWGAFADADLVVEAARQGLGLALLPTYIGDAHPELEPLDGPLLHAGDMWLVSRPDLRDNARLREARRALREGLRCCELLTRPRGASMHHAVTSTHHDKARQGP